MYEDVNQFLENHSKVLAAQSMNVGDSYSIQVNKDPTLGLKLTQEASQISDQATMRQEQSKLLVRKLQESVERARHSANKSNLQMSSLKSGKGIEKVYETIIQDLSSKAMTKKEGIRSQMEQDSMTTQYEQRQKEDLKKFQTVFTQVNELDISGQTDVILENRDKIMQVTNECEQLRINADVYASLVA